MVETGEPHPKPARGGNSYTRFAVVAVAAVAIFAAVYLLDLQSYLRGVLEWVEGLGAWSVLAFVALYVWATVLLIPASLLTIGAGAIWGLLWGLPLVSISSILGASAAFLVGRYLARDWAKHLLEGRQGFKAVDEAVGEEGWKIVALTRLSPLFPFNLQNYAYGLTSVSFRHYFFASWIAMLPGTLLYVYIGAAAGSLADVGSDDDTASTGRWVLFAGGMLATIVVTVYVTRIARKKLQEKINTAEATAAD
ncbi:MAG: TVP38/TMEM64 family protein [Candidatus Hydrogenedentales bacterium]